MPSGLARPPTGEKYGEFDHSTQSDWPTSGICHSPDADSGLEPSRDWWYRAIVQRNHSWSRLTKTAEASISGAVPRHPNDVEWSGRGASGPRSQNGRSMLFRSFRSRGSLLHARYKHRSENGAPERSRTSDLLVRSQTLYPAELRARRCEPLYYTEVRR